MKMENQRTFSRGFQHRQTVKILTISQKLKAFGNSFPMVTFSRVRVVSSAYFVSDNSYERRYVVGF